MYEQKMGEDLGLNSQYVNKILKLKNSNRIKAVLVGRDPYDDALKIPFAVKDWAGLPGGGKGNSGRYLLQSLTGLSHKDLTLRYDNPTKCINDYLLACGVILLNSSYRFLKKCLDRKKARDESYAFNKLFYQHCDNIYILGKKPQASHRARNKQDGFSFEEIPHPCCQAKSRNKDLWESYWKIDSLRKILLLSTNHS